MENFTAGGTDTLGSAAKAWILLAQSIQQQRAKTQYFFHKNPPFLKLSYNTNQHIFAFYNRKMLKLYVPLITNFQNASPILIKFNLNILRSYIYISYNYKIF